MTEYELLYIIAGDQTEDNTAKVVDEVNRILLDGGGKVLSEDPWGRRQLAYEIAGHAYGWYVITRFETEAASLAQIQRALNLNQSVIRTMLVRADDLPSDEDRAKLEDIMRRREQGAPEAKSDTPKKSEQRAGTSRPAKPDTSEPAEAGGAGNLDQGLHKVLDEDNT